MTQSITVADAAIAIGGDLTGFDKSLTVADTHAQTLGAKLKAVFSPKAIMAGIGTAGGAVFGMALAGADKLDAAMRQLQADTGMTDAAAKVAETAMAGMYQHNLQGFATIGDTLAVVTNGLDLTGAAADAMTEKFLKFETATGQGAGAVSAFHEILNAWNLTAEAAPGIMDQLVASHQKYGSVVTENQSALLAIAPAMQAMNMSIDDGIGLLNLFDTAGINASKAPMALQRAIATLQPGQTINDLISQISSIVDPTERAQAAMKVFGARGGVQMAQAFQPGITSVNQFKTSVEENTAATDKGAAAIESGFGNRATLYLHQFGGALAEIGTNFGGLAMLASVIGPGLTKAIGAGLGGLAGLLIPKVTAAVLETGAPAAVAGTGVGTAIGTAIAAAVPIGIAVAGGLAIALAFKAIFLDPGLQQQTRDIGKAVGEQIATGTLEQLQQSKGALEKGIADINALPLGGFLAGDQVRDLQTQLDAVNAKLLAGGEEMPKSVAAGITKTAPVVEIAVDKLVETLGTSMHGVLAAAKITGADGMLAMAQGVTAARQKPLDAFNTLKEMLKHAMSPMAEIARLHGELTDKALAMGLKSGDPAVRAQAIAVAKAAAARLGELAAGGGAAGKAAMHELDKNIRSKIPTVRDAAKAAKNAAVAQLNATAGPAGVAGAAAAAAFAGPISAAVRAAMAAMLAADAKAGVVSHPLVVPGFATGTPYVPYDMLAQVHQGEIIVRRAQSDAIRAGQATLGEGGGGRGGGHTFYINNPVPEKASESVPRALTNLAFLGVG